MLQYLREISGGFYLKRGVAQEHAVEMSVRTYQAGHDDFAAGVDDFFGFALSYQTALHRNYAAVFNNHRPIRNNSTIFIHGYD
jgi:hypothetical protein